MTEQIFETLYQTAADLIIQRHKPGAHAVSAAVMGASGKVYSAVNLDCYLRRAAVCAEPGAIAAAMSAGEPHITAILAVRYNSESPDAPRVVSPCGICRELIADYGPGAAIFVPDGDDVKKTAVGALLPNRYAKQGKEAR